MRYKRGFQNCCVKRMPERIIMKRISSKTRVVGYRKGKRILIA